MLLKHEEFHTGWEFSWGLVLTLLTTTGSTFGELTERNWLIQGMEGHKLCISCTPLYISFHYFCRTSLPRCHNCNPICHCDEHKNPSLPDHRYNSTSTCSTLYNWDQPAGWEPSQSAWSRMVVWPAHCCSTDAGKLRLTQILRQPQAKLRRALPISLWFLLPMISPCWGVLPFEFWLHLTLAILERKAKLAFCF